VWWGTWGTPDFCVGRGGGSLSKRSGHMPPRVWEHGVTRRHVPPDFPLSLVNPLWYTWVRTALPLPIPSAAHRIGIEKDGDDL